MRSGLGDAAPTARAVPRRMGISREDEICLVEREMLILRNRLARLNSRMAALKESPSLEAENVEPCGEQI